MRKPLPLSVAIITLNEEKNLRRCLESVRDLCAEIVVVDSGSTDATGDIARSFAAKFVVETWKGHVAQKNSALQKCSQPWVLCVDADEVVSPELATSIASRFANGEPPEAGFFINRRTSYLGRWIWHAWYPEWHLRLIRKSSAKWGGRDPHDKLEVDGDTAKLDGDLLHYTYESVDHHLQQTLKYARISAGVLEQSGKSVGLQHLIFSPWLAFLKKLIFKQSWRDGWRGWLIAYATGFGVFAKYAFAMEKKIKSDDIDVSPTSQGEPKQKR